MRAYAHFWRDREICHRDHQGVAEDPAATCHRRVEPISRAALQQRACPRERRATRSIARYGTLRARQSGKPVWRWQPASRRQRRTATAYTLSLSEARRIARTSRLRTPYRPLLKDQARLEAAV